MNTYQFFNSLNGTKMLCQWMQFFFTVSSVQKDKNFEPRGEKFKMGKKNEKFCHSHRKVSSDAGKFKNLVFIRSHPEF